MFEFKTRLAKCQLGAALTSFVANFFLFIATITPAWQVAEDLDADRYVQSGLWLYCPGASQCWYIFSDSLINYYERVDVCRFFLIGDCRKKLLRTPYFFGWHYAVLILNVCAMVFLLFTTLSALVSYFKPSRARVAAIVNAIFAFAAGLFLSISLIVFMVNAEMLESKYLIGIKNTFEKYYGYSFYLAGLSLLIIMFSLLFAVMLITYTFFFVETDTLERYEAAQQIENPHLYLDSMSSPMGTAYAKLPPLSTEHGSYIPPARSPNGEFKSQTRTFYSY
ncbi:unnamed protein product [Caenorhabditis auriculariae]|uniref:Uncharacterized protein n=1 Tax=Caenorhabditis auriculariae TaxID=2777116 RepID=A0A8S1H0S5_9PELO|nr:unnamed protein product [Caenorhabditis auriculariae]